MSGEGEIIGDLAQAALTARALEPAHGEGGDGHTHEAACLNCGTTLTGSHCHACGQAAHVHRTLGAFFHDLLHGVFHFEGKIWRTLPMLAWQPGRLTREYIEGKRASYVSPIALFLFMVFLTFALFNQITTPIDWTATNAQGQKVGLDQAKADVRREIEVLERRLAEAKRQGRAVPGLEGELTGARGELEGIEAIERGEMPDSITTRAPPEDRQIANRIDQAWGKIKANPALAAYKLQSNAYKFSWLLIPISVPFLWLLFPFSRRFHLYDHTVFVTYSVSFMMVLLAGATLANLSSWFAWLTPAFLLYVPFHLYRQLRGAYHLSRRGALLRLPLPLTFATTALWLWGVALLALVIAG